MKYSCIIWDFNGTIINDAPLSLSVINRMLEKRGKPLLSGLEEHKEKFCFPVKKYYEAIGFDFSCEPYEVPAEEWVVGYGEGEATVELTEGICDALKKIQSLGIKQIVLSASELKMLFRQLDRYGIRDYFDAVIGTDDIYGNGKIEQAKSYARNADFDIKNALLIGDTLHDSEISLALGCGCVLFSGGHMDKKRLAASGFPVVDSMEELISTFFE